MQTKVYELEDQVRRVAESKNEFQGEIQRQKEKFNQIENSYKTQLEEAQSICSQDKVNNKTVIVQIVTENGTRG